MPGNTGDIVESFDSVGVLPGTFNPPTIAHLEMARVAVTHCGLSRVELVLSRVSLGKEALARPTVDDRERVLLTVASTRPWLSVRVTDARLIADLALGYDALVLGADKWRQVLDASWYDSPAARDDALARLPPRVLVAPRDGDAPDGVEILAIDDQFTRMSSSLARAGQHELMLTEAAASGLWATDP